MKKYIIVLIKVLSYLSILEIIIQYVKWKYKYYEINVENGSATLNEIKELKERMEQIYYFIEWWVAGHNILAIVASLLLFYFFDASYTIPIYIIVFYGLSRVFEIIIKQIRVILFDTIGVKAIAIKSARRSIILLIHNIIEMIFWFSSSFMGIILLNKEIVNEGFNKLADIYSYWDFVWCSTLQMTVFSSGCTKLQEIIRPDNWMSIITQIEILIGFIIIVISLARLFGILPNVKQMEK